MKPEQKYFRPGQFLFREGDSAQAMYLIQKGTVAIRKAKGNGYVEIAKIYQNEVLGELGFFDRLPRSASAIALTEVEVLEIKFEGLEKLYDSFPTYFKTILACVAERMRRANDMIRRLQKNLVSETEGVVGHDSKSPDEDTLNTAAILATVTDSPDSSS